MESLLIPVGLRRWHGRRDRIGGSGRDFSQHGNGEERDNQVCEDEFHNLSVRCDLGRIRIQVISGAQATRVDRFCVGQMPLIWRLNALSLVSS
jgi:hypothetical protein